MLDAAEFHLADEWWVPAVALIAITVLGLESVSEWVFQWE